MTKASIEQVTPAAAGNGSAGKRRVVIDPVTRVEGHGKVTIILDNEGRVERARLHIVEFRGFERFIHGRLLWEVPVIVQRLCGICPVSHHLTAAKAMDLIVGADQLTPPAEKLRRLMHYGQILQSHAVHFFHLASPDLLLGLDAPPERRNVVGVIMEYPDIARKGILLRKLGQEVINATGGKRIHPTGAVPGGMNKPLTMQERDVLLVGLDTALQWAQEAVALIRDYTLRNAPLLDTMGTFVSNRLCILAEDGTLDLYDGALRAVDEQGETIFADVPAAFYLDYIMEEVRPWSYMKFPFIKQLGPRHGWYRVGPLARVATCRAIDTPLADRARREMLTELGPRAQSMGMAAHWARLIEALHAAEKIEQLLHDPDLQSSDLVTKGERREEAVAVLEAPRGTLFHHYRVDRNDLVTMANLIVSTTQNNEPMNRAVEVTARHYLDGATITEGLLNRIEAAIRAYDPCLSCAVHAVGRMPLEVELRDCAGELVDWRARVP
jgi:NAD-reducing hydrogenase large subunit